MYTKLPPEHGADLVQGRGAGADLLDVQVGRVPPSEGAFHDADEAGVVVLHFVEALGMLQVQGVTDGGDSSIGAVRETAAVDLDG